MPLPFASGLPFAKEAQAPSTRGMEKMLLSIYFSSEKFDTVPAILSKHKEGMSLSGFVKQLHDFTKREFHLWPHQIDLQLNADRSKMWPLQKVLITPDFYGRLAYRAARKSSNRRSPRTLILVTPVEEQPEKENNFLCAESLVAFSGVMQSVCPVLKASEKTHAVLREAGWRQQPLIIATRPWVQHDAKSDKGKILVTLPVDRMDQIAAVSKEEFSAISSLLKKIDEGPLRMTSEPGGQKKFHL